MTSRRPPPPGPEPRDPVDALLEVREKRRGKRMGDAYVKIVRPFEDTFERGGEAGTLVASERTVLHRSGWTALLRQVRTTLIGRPISTDREQHERLSKTKALAIFSSDNLSSSAYATEEMLLVLILAGAAHLYLALPVAIFIVTTATVRALASALMMGANWSPRRR